MSDRGLAWLAHLLAADDVLPEQNCARLRIDEVVREFEARAEEASASSRGPDRCRAASPSLPRRVG